jgi:hypothetical protein
MYVIFYQAIWVSHEQNLFIQFVFTIFAILFESYSWMFIYERTLYLYFVFIFFPLCIA